MELSCRSAVRPAVRPAVPSCAPQRRSRPPARLIASRLNPVQPAQVPASYPDEPVIDTFEQRWHDRGTREGQDKQGQGREGCRRGMHPGALNVGVVELPPAGRKGGMQEARRP